MEPNISRDFVFPEWLPDAARLYLDHTGEGVSLRELARREGVAASTVMRQVRRCEARRDDPLVDEALAALALLQTGSPHHSRNPSASSDRKDSPEMASQSQVTPISAAGRLPADLDEAAIRREGRRVLRRLAEPSAVMAIAPDMEKAAVLRPAADGRMVQTAVLDRSVAQVFALKDWIQVLRLQGRLTTYEITAAGRTALRQFIEEEDRRRMSHHAPFGMAEAATPFDMGGEARGDDAARRARFSLVESPVSVLARRREKDGRRFLEPELVQAAERLREDFELAQMAGRGNFGWDKFLSVVPVSPGAPAEPVIDASAALNATGAPAVARTRVEAALTDLGPGLADVALRVCCHLEGLEVCEKRMGWAARSGKIVLRIALQRLRRHYDEAYGRAGPLIG